MMPHFCHTFLIHPFPLFCLTEEPQDEAFKQSKRKKKKTPPLFPQVSACSHGGILLAPPDISDLMFSSH